jgi:tetratricopeptide (TPR) repeat protein
MMLAACYGALVTLPVHGLVDSPQLWNPVLVVMAVVFVIILRTAPAATSAPRFIAIPRVLAAGVVAVLAVGWLSLGIAHSRYSHSQELLASGALDEALKPASKAATSWTSSPAAQLNAGIVAGLIYQNDSTEAHLAAAKGFFEDAIASDPNSALAYANLAQLQLEAGDEDDAAASAQSALSRAKHDPVIAALAGSVFEAAGETDRAVSAYALAVAKEPRLAQSLFWQTTPTRMTLRPQVIEASGIDACDQGLAAVLYGAYGDDLPALLAGCEGRIAAGAANTDDRVGRVLLLSALGRSEEAIAGGRDLVRVARASNGSRMAQGDALSASGDLQAVRHELLLAAFSGNRDARLLLSFTYAGGTEGRNQVSPVLSLIAGPEPVPAEVRRVIDGSRAPTPGYATVADYNAEEKYFEIDLLRTAPSVMLLPGDWQKLVSPREAGFDDVLALR